MAICSLIASDGHYRKNEKLKNVSKWCKIAKIAKIKQKKNFVIFPSDGH